MNLFYLPEAAQGIQELPAEEARHVVQVLRRRVGDRLDLVDGRGGWYSGEIVALDKRHCQLQVSLIRREAAERPYRVTLAVAPTKSTDRLEWLLEKATEIGVDEIVPLQCRRSERTKLRTERLEKVLIAAMKQSLRAWLPRLAPLTDFGQLLTNRPEGEQRYIAWIDPDVNTLLSKNYEAGRDVCVLIGPEGDFTPEEVEEAGRAGFLPVSLGPHRLRTETAAIVAVHTVSVVNQMNRD